MVWKRCLDLAVAMLAVVLLAPLFAIIALAVRLAMGSPVIFRQVRPGLNGRLFTMLKFRTMLDAKGPGGRPLPDAERLTALGRLLRRTSLDELPELWNVVRGEMSLVGPRPLLVEYTPYFTQEERVRFAVRPGISGWAQVNGRNEAAWDVRLQNDVWYVRNWSMLLDIKILWLTIVNVFACRHVIADPGSAMLDLDEERAHLQPCRK